MKTINLEYDGISIELDFDDNYKCIKRKVLCDDYQSKSKDIHNTVNHIIRLIEFELEQVLEAKKEQDFKNMISSAVVELLNKK